MVNHVTACRYRAYLHSLPRQFIKDLWISRSYLHPKPSEGLALGPIHHTELFVVMTYWFTDKGRQYYNKPREVCSMPYSTFCVRGKPPNNIATPREFYTSKCILLNEHMCLSFDLTEVSVEWTALEKLNTINEPALMASNTILTVPCYAQEQCTFEMMI